jgi:hypothetical protein
MRILILITLQLCFFTSLAHAYELVIIQGLSKSKQTFVTRNRKNNRYIEGQKVTFTNNNVSIIARAFKRTSEFTQWEILNDFTDVPFQKGEIVTMYPAEEYLWALSPQTVKRRYIKDKIFTSKKSFESRFAFTRGLSESVSQAAPGSPDRGGYQFEAMYKTQYDFSWAYSFGLRYTQETVNLTQASLVNTRLAAMADARYYFNKMENFYDAQVGISLGLGFGQSRTSTSGQTSFGDVLILPSTKISLDLPINTEYEFGFYAGFESIRMEESFVDNTIQTTNLNNSQLGFVFRSHIN